jgi:serine/threonine-protein kinase
VPPKGERLTVDDVNALRAFAISPDGSRLVYAVEKGATSELRLRQLDEAVSTAIPGTEGATNPFFSPDGKWVAFVAGPKLKKVALAGGTPVTIADTPVFRGAVWGDDGAIYWVPNLYVPILRIPAEGGVARPVTRIDTAAGEMLHRWPDLLPGDKVLLYTIGYGGEWDDATIVAQRLDTGERRVLIKGGTSPHYLPGGWLVYARGGDLYAVRLDPRSLTVSGSPVAVATNVLIDGRGLAHLDVARTGLLVTTPADAVAGGGILSWVDREGRGEPLPLPPASRLFVKLSPRGDRAVVGIGNGVAILDLARLSLARLTLARRAETPLWSVDERRVYFGYEQGKSYQIFVKSADDTGSPELVVPSEVQEDPFSLTADGTQMLGMTTPPSGISALMVHDLRNPRATPRVLVASAYLDNTSATFSPDGRFVAYQSEESGRPEIFVRPASGEDRKWQVSVDGGTWPVWSPVGDEIFFLAGAQLLAAPVAAKGDELVVGAPKVLFANHQITAYDVTRDGKRFLVAEDPNPGAPTRLDVVVHWDAEVRKKLAEAQAP